MSLTFFSLGVKTSTRCRNLDILLTNRSWAIKGFARTNRNSRCRGHERRIDLKDNASSLFMWIACYHVSKTRILLCRWFGERPLLQKEPCFWIVLSFQRKAFIRKQNPLNHWNMNAQTIVVLFPLSGENFASWEWTACECTFFLHNVATFKTLVLCRFS